MPLVPWAMLGICSLSMLVLYETLFVPVLTYGSETMLWREKARSRLRAVQMENLRELRGIRRMDRVQNSRIRKLCGVRKGLDESIDEGVLRWLGHVESMERDKITKRVYVGESAGIRSDGLIP